MWGGNGLFFPPALVLSVKNSNPARAGLAVAFALALLTLKSSPKGGMDPADRGAPG